MLISVHGAIIDLSDKFESATVTSTSAVEGDMSKIVSPGWDRSEFIKLTGINT